MSASPRQLVERLTIGQRIGLAAAFIITVAGLLVMSRLGGAGPMALLFSDLDAETAATAIGELETRGIPYELTDGGRAILVPATEVLDLRIALAADGAVQPVEGWGVLDSQGLTASDFDQRVGFQRAIEGELARTISAIDGVNGASVHLVMPERDLFSGDNVMPTASVLLETGGVAISSSQVRSIVNLVAYSVEGLTVDEVSVTDEKGRPLASPEDGVTAGGSAALEQQTALENQLKTQLDDLLVATAGPGNAVASISAQLDFATSAVTTERFDDPTDPANPLPLSESVTRERYRGDADQADIGVLGPEDDITDNATDANGNGLAYDLDKSDVEYAIGRTITTTESAPGTIRSLSVAVLLNEDNIDAAAAAKVEEMVAAAIGYDPDRGDTLAVTVLPFNEDYVSPDLLAFADDTPVTETGFSIIDLVRMGLIGMVAIVATLLVALFGFRGRKGPQVVALSPADLVDDDPDLEAIGAATVAALGTGRDIPTTTADLVGLIETQPEDVAGMLRTWMAEDVGAKS